MSEYNLSFHDLYLVDGFKDAVDTENKKLFEAILHNNGMDVALGYELVACHHRTLNNILYHGIRVEGWERIDEAWLKAIGKHSDAYISAVKDPHLRHTLRKMRDVGLVDKAFEPQ